MNLKAFLETCQKDIIDFEKEWNKGKKEFPEHYPDELDEGTWFDQFLSFLTSSTIEETEKIGTENCPLCGCELKIKQNGGVECSNEECDYWECF